MVFFLTNEKNAVKCKNKLKFKVRITLTLLVYNLTILDSLKYLF